MKYLTTEFLWCLIISFILILASLSFVANQAYHTVSQEKASQVQDELESRMSKATAPSIFVNNLAVSWFLAVPLLGAIPFGIVWCNNSVRSSEPGLVVSER